jgi:hypothetical protein
MSDLITWAKGILGTAGFIVVITIITLIVQTYRHWKKVKKTAKCLARKITFCCGGSDENEVNKVVEINFMNFIINFDVIFTSFNF